MTLWYDSEAVYLSNCFLEFWLSSLLTREFAPRYNDVSAFLRSRGVLNIDNIVDRVCYQVARQIEIRPIKFGG